MVLDVAQTSTKDCCHYRSVCIVVFDLRKQHRLSFVSYLFVPVYFSFVFPGRNFFLKLAVFRRKFKLCQSSKGLFTRYDFVACDKLYDRLFTIGLRHKLYRVNQTYHSLTTVVHVAKNVVGF